MSDARDVLLTTLEENRLLAEHSPSPFYAGLLALRKVLMGDVAVAGERGPSHVRGDD